MEAKGFVRIIDVTGNKLAECGTYTMKVRKVFMLVK